MVVFGDHHEAILGLSLDVPIPDELSHAVSPALANGIGTNKPEALPNGMTVTNNGPIHFVDVTLNLRDLAALLDDANEVDRDTAMTEES